MTTTLLQFEYWGGFRRLATAERDQSILQILAGLRERGEPAEMAAMLGRRRLSATCTPASLHLHVNYLPNMIHVFPSLPGGSMVKTLFVHYKCRQFTFREIDNITMAQARDLVQGSPREAVHLRLGTRTIKLDILHTFADYNIMEEEATIRVGEACGPDAWCDVCMHRMRILENVVNAPSTVLRTIFLYAVETMP